MKQTLEREKLAFLPHSGSLVHEMTWLCVKISSRAYAVWIMAVTQQSTDAEAQP